MTTKAPDTAQPAIAPKKSIGGGRSVNYPYITLAEAIKRAKALWEHVGKNLVPIATAAPFWGYGEKSSGVRSTVSALKQYGLIVDEGDGDNRQIRLSERGLDVAIDSTDPQKRQSALRQAASTPKIYQEILARFPEGLPKADSAISAFLLREKEFNRKTVDAFIADFRANLQLADIASPANMPPKKDNDAPGIKIKVGDYVQWTAGGVDQFATPKRLARFSPDLKFGFADGEDCGMPVEELAVVDPPIQPPDAVKGTLTHGFAQDVYTLGHEEGQVILQWPQKMSQDSYDEFVDWLDLQKRKIARLNGIKVERKD